MGSQTEIYQTPDNLIQREVRLEDNTVWLSQEQLITLIDRGKSVISRHIRNVFKEGELGTKSNMQIMHIPVHDKPVAFYNIDVTISVESLVTKRGTRFRQWATQQMKKIK